MATNDKKREYARKYRAEHREQINARAREYERKYRAEHREQINARARMYARKYYAAHKDQRREYDQRYRTKNRSAIRHRMLMRLYGISLEEFDAMLLGQGGRCAVCERPGRRFHVDHDHATGNVRGILCHTCNEALGLMKDSPKLCRSAAVYLEGRKK